MTLSLYSELLLLLMVVLAASNDLISRRIPNRLLLLCGLGAIGLLLLGPDPGNALLTALGGAATGFAVFLPLYLLRGMAAGDVKLMATVGLFLSAAEVAWVAVLTVCVGGLMALVVIVWGGRWRHAWANVLTLLRPLWLAMSGIRLAPEAMPNTSVGNLPYGLAIASATVWFVAQRHC